MSQKFTVMGNGQFPIDMLRYDACWPANVESTAAIEQTLKSRTHATFDPIVHRTVDLYTSRPQGYTAARWASFGWYVQGADELCEWCAKAPKRPGKRTCSNLCSDEWIQAGT